LASVNAPPLHRANVVVVLNASDRDHFAVSGEAPYRAGCPDWAELTFIADHDLSDGLAELLEDELPDAVVFASNALASAVSQRAIAQRRFVDLWHEDGQSKDVGVVVLHQYTRPGERLALKFLGSSGFSLVGIPPRRVEANQIRFRDDWMFTDSATHDERGRRFRALSRGYGLERHCVWTELELDLPLQWEPVAWANGEPLVATCAAGDRVVVVSLVPIDLTGETELLGSVLAACLRPRGCLVAEATDTTGTSAFSTSLASALDRHRFVHRIRPASTAEVDPGRAPYHFFDELIVAPEWRVDELESFTEKAVLRKLEQGGSLVATFAGPAGRPVAVRLSGQPQYAERANQLARWLLPRLDAFKGDVWAMHGLAEVVVAIEGAYEDPRLIPQALRAEYVRRHLVAQLEGRVEDDSVDKLVLPTAAAYSALRALEVKAIDGMRAWIETRLDDEVVPSLIAQALVLVPELRTPKRIERVRASTLEPEKHADDAGLLEAYAAVLLAAGEPERIRKAVANQALGLGVQAELLRAATREGVPATSGIVALGVHVRDEIDRLADGEGALEAVCLGNAALIELARRQGIAPHAEVRGRPREVDARTVESTELVKQRETALREADEARRAGRQATTAFAGILVAVTVLAILAIAIWGAGDVAAKFGFATGVFALMSSFIGYVAKKAHDAGVPPWPIK